MLERKWTALIAVAFETGDIVTAGCAHSRCREAAVRIVTIDAMHGALRELVSERPVKARPDRRMATGAQRIAGTGDIRRMNAMATVAGDAVPGMRRFKAARLNGVGFVAAQTPPVHGIGLTACVGHQLIRVKSLDMRQARPMT